METFQNSISYLESCSLLNTLSYLFRQSLLTFVFTKHATSLSHYHSSTVPTKFHVDIQSVKNKQRANSKTRQGRVTVLVQCTFAQWDLPTKFHVDTSCCFKVMPRTRIADGRTKLQLYPYPSRGIKIAQSYLNWTWPQYPYDKSVHEIIGIFQIKGALLHQKLLDHTQSRTWPRYSFFQYVPPPLRKWTEKANNWNFSKSKGNYFIQNCLIIPKNWTRPRYPYDKSVNKISFQYVQPLRRKWTDQVISEFLISYFILFRPRLYAFIQEITLVQ
jgi:hypothetical protein